MSTAKANLTDLIAAANHVANEVKTTFGQLTVTQLNWKPSAERWSVAQCFDHLLTTNKGYFPVIENVLGGQKRTLWQNVPVLPGLMGKLLIKALDPASTRKLKAPKKFQPAQSDVSGSVINDFVNQQARIVEGMKATQGFDLEKIVI